MAELQFKLEVFEGPLDLLLHLITKHKLNIHDIEITKLLEQYLLYMNQARQQDLELAGEFLEMAARLIYIKTISLLPKLEEAEKAKQELQGNLIEYAFTQAIAVQLRKNFIADDIFVRKPVKLPKIKQDYQLKHSPEQLAEVYVKIGKFGMQEKLLTEKITDTVKQEKTVSVISKVIFILRKLYDGKSVKINSLYENITDRSARVAIFLAILELTKFGRIMLNEDNTLVTICQKSKKVGDNSA
ncbi:MAG: segregation/condensation protein A [Oscillospiraceae bacterium]|nr:segregation/condensation protein A [Oscillospiraceae bacterium]